MPASSPRPSHHRESTALFLGTLAIFCVGVFIFLKPFFKETALPASDNAASDSPEASTSDQKGLPFISVQDIWLALGQGKELEFLDIRSSEAFRQSHIPFSQSVPEGNFSTQPTPQKDAAVIVFSLDQAASLQAVHETLKKANVPHFFVTGGITSLEQEHYPLISFGDPDSFSDRSKVTYFTADETKKYLDANTEGRFLFVDVRSTKEFAFARVKGAVNIPLESIESQSATLSRSVTLLVYGNTMLEAFQAAVRLSDLNFALVRAISDAPADLEKAGVPVEKGSGS